MCFSHRTIAGVVTEGMELKPTCDVCHCHPHTQGDKGSWAETPPSLLFSWSSLAYIPKHWPAVAAALGLEPPLPSLPLPQGPSPSWLSSASTVGEDPHCYPSSPAHRQCYRLWPVASGKRFNTCNFSKDNCPRGRSPILSKHALCCLLES